MPKNLTVSISDDLAEKMDKLKDVNWSWICEMAISERILVSIQAEEVLRLKSEIQKG
jgi:predicted transcriptional regulator